MGGRKIYNINWRFTMIRLLSVKEVANYTGIPVATLRFWIKKGKSPVNFRRLPSGRLVISEDELKKAIETLPMHKGVTK